MGEPSKVSADAAGSTSVSLLDRVRQQDDMAWQRLIDLYGPLIYHWCRQWGLQATDAADVGQQVCLSIFQAIGQFQHRGVHGAFRAWLKTIAHHKVVDLWRARGRDRVVSQAEWDDVVQRDAGVDDPPGTASDETRQLYHRAAELVRVDFSETTWRAFWMAVVEERPVGHIAEELGISPNAVYIAKSRVLTRLRTEFADLLD